MILRYRSNLMKQKTNQEDAMNTKITYVDSFLPIIVLPILIMGAPLVLWFRTRERLPREVFPRLDLPRGGLPREVAPLILFTLFRPVPLATGIFVTISTTLGFILKTELRSCDWRAEALVILMFPFVFELLMLTSVIVAFRIIQYDDIENRSTIDYLKSQKCPDLTLCLYF